MRTKRTIYWVLTVFLAFSMLAGGIQQVFQMESFITIMDQLDYPRYFCTIIGVWKLLGVIAILIPGKPILKEWAYAGFFFTMSGAVISHWAVGQTFAESIPAAIQVVVVLLSWYFKKYR